MAAKAFRVDPEYKDEFLTLYQVISDGMLNGDMWKESGKGRTEVKSVKQSAFILLTSRLMEAAAVDKLEQ